MLHVVSNGKARSGTSANSSTNRAQTGQGAQSTGSAKAPANQPTQKQAGGSGRPTTAKSNTTSTATAKSNTTSTATAKSNTTSTATAKSNTTSTASAPVQHKSFMPDERIAKLSAEGDKRAAIETAWSTYKKAIDAEARAKKAYMEDKKSTDADKYMCGRDWMTAEWTAADLGNVWEKAAHSAATAHEALKRAMAE